MWSRAASRQLETHRCRRRLLFGSQTPRSLALTQGRVEIWRPEQRVIILQLVTEATCREGAKETRSPCSTDKNAPRPVLDRRSEVVTPD
eukprot:COSAG01_NODE_2303_length_7952_cov_4.127849_6_plen_89_part_00